MTDEQILALAGDHGVKFVRLQFLDILGVAKNVAIPIRQLGRALANGIMFDGSSIEGFARIEESDMNLRPVLDSFAILPRSPACDEVEAQLICDVYTPDGAPFVGDPRYILRQAVDRAAEKGLTVKIGLECEFFLFKKRSGKKVSTATSDQGGYFDLSPGDEGEIARREIVMHLEEMGFEVESSHHETVPGQHEIDFGLAEALVVADRFATLRTVARAVADAHGLQATFIPKPLIGVDGSGLHTHLALFRSGENVFFDPDGHARLSETALYFIGGLLSHARALTALTNPLVNSYKRLVPGFEAPFHVSWSAQNRNALVRVPSGRGAETRIEMRAPDPACNPYLALAVMIQAGLDGVERRLAPPKPVTGHIYRKSQTELAAEGVGRLPNSLREALDEMAKSELVRKAIGQHIFQHFLAAKSIEWDIYRTQVHRWELEQYMGVF
ncbi:MAG: type I glutamate--ammonia ligase [Bacteroidota bacterium]